MKTPNWLARIIISYLSNRKLSIRYRREVSDRRNMPGGLGAGTVMGLNLFLVLFNGAGPAASTVGIGQQITQPIRRRKPISKTKVKWIDDCTLGTAVNLKVSLMPEDRPLPRPRPYHARTEHKLPRESNLMQDQLDSLCLYTNNHLMEINRSKTKAILCNTRTKWDFIPELSLYNNDDIEIVNELKIVGFIMRSDMRTSANTDYLVKKAFKRMWLIRRLKALGASINQLLDTLHKQVLSVLWLGAPAWFSQLTQHERQDLDRVAKVGLRIIYGEAYSGFENMLQAASLLRPTVQLSRMTAKFAARSTKHPKFSKWFQPAAPKLVNTRSSNHTQLYTSVPARTERYRNSPIPYMTELLNAKHKK